MFKFFYCDVIVEIGDFGGLCIRVDWVVDQDQGFWLGFGILFGKDCGCCQCQWCGLVDGDYIGVWFQMVDEIDQILGVIFDIEFVCVDWNILCIVLICYIYVIVWEQRDYCGLQKGCVMVGYWCYQQNFVGYWFVLGDVEMQQVVEIVLQYWFGIDDVVLIGF